MSSFIDTELCIRKIVKCWKIDIRFPREIEWENEEDAMIKSNNSKDEELLRGQSLVKQTAVVLVFHYAAVGFWWFFSFNATG